MKAALPGDLACRELVELATDHLEGALAPGERTRLELHLAVCPACAAYLRQLRGVLRAARRARGLPLPGEVRERLLAAFRACRRGPA